MSLSVSKTIGSSSHEPRFLEGFNLKFNEAIASYREFRRFNITNLSEARLIFLGEDHTDDQCDIMKTAVMNLFASQGPVIILHEGIPSGEIASEEKKISLGKKHFQPHSIRVPYHKNIHIVGWDASKDLLKKLESVVLGAAYVGREFRAEKDNYNRLEAAYEKFLDKPFDAASASKGELKNRIEVMERTERVLEETMQTIEAFHQEGIQLAKEYLQHDSKNEIPGTMHIRDEALRSTIQQLDEIKDQLHLSKDVPVIVIAGALHLKDDEEDLSPLYDELDKNHKAVILIPSHIWD